MKFWIDQPPRGAQLCSAATRDVAYAREHYQKLNRYHVCSRINIKYS